MTEAQSQAVLTMLEYTARQVVELRKEVSELRRRIRTPRKTEPNSVKLQRARRQIQKLQTENLKLHKLIETQI